MLAARDAPICGQLGSVQPKVNAHPHSHANEKHGTERVRHPWRETNALH